ncbi:MAG: alpha/beta fold hydrolase [Acidimicrobiia bacterium]|nr:alpha/beta fold hydrolase [Acidimicrobiia bacterium]
MSSTERKRTDGGLALGKLETELVPGPVEYATLTPGPLRSSDQPILIWLHGGGGSRRFLESCRLQFMACWSDRSLPAMTVATPSAAWSFYLDRHDGAELWETFILDEFIPHIRSETGCLTGPVFIGGISVGALGALRMAFKHPERFAGVVAVEPAVEAALSWDRVLSRDQVYMPAALRRRLFGEPLDHQFWKANHPTSLAIDNSAAIAASGLSIYVEAGDEDRMHVQYGAELLHRCLFDIGVQHEYRLTRGGNHVGPSVGPRVAEALRYIGRILWKTYDVGESIDSLVEMEGFAAQVGQLEVASGYRRDIRVDGVDCELQVRMQGDGPPVVLLPSLGRTVDDFAYLADRIAAAGYRSLALEPRGLSGSSAAVANITLNDLAKDVAAVIRHNNGGPAAIIGHDFGGQVARTTATKFPSLVRHLVLLATPGPELPRPEPATAHRRVFIPSLTMEEHLEAVAVAFFAEGNDPVAWVDGWHPLLASAQLEAQQRTPTKDWITGGVSETLIIRPQHDRMVSPESTRLLANELGGKVSVIEIPDAGHALLPEQPQAVAVAVLTWLRRQG